MHSEAFYGRIGARNLDLRSENSFKRSAPIVIYLFSKDLCSINYLVLINILIFM